MRTQTRAHTIPPRRPPKRMPAKAAPAGTPEPFPARIAPMNAQVAERPFNHSDWVFEPKLDGYRATAYINDGEVKLLTRSGHDYSSYFPHIVQDLAARPSPPMGSMLSWLRLQAARHRSRRCRDE
jgi:bifunctional non-homologous end joining protein LigD